MSEIHVQDIDGVKVYMEPGQGKFVATVGGKRVTRSALVDIRRLIEEHANAQERRVPATLIRWDWHGLVEIRKIVLTGTRKNSRTKAREYRTTDGEWIESRWVYRCPTETEELLSLERNRQIESKRRAEKLIEETPYFTIDDFKAAGVTK